MRVKDIQIDGFGVWTGLSVESLNDKMTLFYGPNEAGKTTLMQFIRAMFYGFSEDRCDRYFPPVFGGTRGGAIRVAGTTGGYTIRRHHEAGIEQHHEQVSVVGPGGSEQGRQQIDTLLGSIDESIFTNVFAIGLRELQELSSLDDTEAADELYKLSTGLDRVSLVEVIRGLKKSRSELIGVADGTDSGQDESLRRLISKRDRLRHEVQTSVHGGQRWVELAAKRQAQEKEIRTLDERVISLEQQARCVEIATSIYETWCQRDELAERIDLLSAEPLLPDDAPKRLKEIESQIDQQRVKVEEIKEKRRGIRVQAEQFPIHRKLVELKPGIEFASQQAPWIETLEEQIRSLGEQLDSLRNQLREDAQRLGFSHLDDVAASSSSLQQLPVLSRKSISSLADPARRVKQQLFLLRQSRSQANEYQEEVDRLGTKLSRTLERASAEDLQHAIRQQSVELKKLRDRVHLGERLHQLKQQFRELDQETIELTTAEALPVDRLLLLAVPFVFGCMAVIYGVAHLLSLTFLVDQPDSTWGVLCVLMGAIGLILFHFGRESGQGRTETERENCERQLISIRKQIRELESEAHGLDSQITPREESLELRVREKEALLDELESTLPLYHQHEAAKQAWKLARQRSRAAATELKKARKSWGDALESIGLSRSMPPTKVKLLSGNYEQLQNGIKRMKELESERQLRQSQRDAIAKNIETLYEQVVHSTFRASIPEGESVGDNSVEVGRRQDALGQLNYLQDELSRQTHWVKLRSKLKEEDLDLKRQQAASSRAAALAEQQQIALWTKCGVGSAEEFYQQLDLKSELLDSIEQHDNLEQTITKMIGAHVERSLVQAEIEDSTTEDLENRWESLTAKISETESTVSQLRTQLGEINQEMKHLSEDASLATQQLELACVERKIESEVKRWKTLALASFLLEDVCATFERERQPETLREASDFLVQLTNGKYQRIWTRLGTNQLHVDDHAGRTIEIDRLSRGTREAVFIALRLSLTAVYARRGVTLPLVLDDVLVNFDGDRAAHAAKTLDAFAKRGHQVLMFTCHRHIVEIFQSIGVETRVMPPHGQPGRAEILDATETDLIARQKTVITEVLSVDGTENDAPVEEEIPGTAALESGSAETKAQSETASHDSSSVSCDSDQGESEVTHAQLTFGDFDSAERTEQEDHAARSVQGAVQSTEATQPNDSQFKPPKSVGITWAWFEKEPAEMLREVESSSIAEANFDEAKEEDSIVNSTSEEQLSPRSFNPVLSTQLKRQAEPSSAIETGLDSARDSSVLNGTAETELSSDAQPTIPGDSLTVNDESAEYEEEDSEYEEEDSEYEEEDSEYEEEDSEYEEEDSEYEDVDAESEDEDGESSLDEEQQDVA